MEQRPQVQAAQATARPGAYGPTALDADAVKVLRNTYMLLALTIAFSTITTTLSVMMNFGIGAMAVGFIGFYGCLFAVHKTRNSGAGLLWTFAATGLLGVALGPTINVYLRMIGPEPILTALAGTATIFFGMSAYTLITRKDFTAISRFVFVGLLVGFIAGIANLFLMIPALSLAVSCVFLFASSLMIGIQTSSIIHGGERNYIMATITLYVALYNIFQSLLMILGVFGDD